MVTRRQTMFGLAGLIAAPAVITDAIGKETAQPFSWEGLQARALQLSRQPWRAPKVGSALLDKMTYDALAKITYRDNKTLWREYEDTSGVRFFPLSMYARRPVDIFVIEKGKARRFSYSPSLFQAPHDHPLTKLGAAGGFSGFRLMNKGNIGDWLAFQGASYFRSAGPLHQYGLSARGIAIDTGLSKTEEFPEFTEFWLERSPEGIVTVYALLDGPSVTGAYRFVNRQSTDEMTQDISAVIHLRDAAERLGIAPQTSMFWYGEGNLNPKRDWTKKDWRPEIHDSDGLAIRTGAGERIWRPVNNPMRPQVNSFSDTSLQGFGLMQRDRHFDHYQDDAVFYEKRPNLWTEPQGDWGAGAVMLYEIPTTSEYEDNIVAFWTPRAPASAGARFAHDYRLRWTGGEPEALSVARIVNCWTGQGGLPGRPHRENAGKIVVDFEGERFSGLDYRSPVEPAVNISNGVLLNSGCYPVAGQKNYWRLILDIERNGAEPADVRAFLRFKNDAITETLLYQLF